MSMPAVPDKTADAEPEATAPHGDAAVPTLRAPSNAAAADSSAPARMDRDFILQHQIVERYLAGRLPVKGAQDFEHYCRGHPQLLDEIALGERINAALRLLEAGGRPSPWEQRPPRWWEQLPVLLGLCGLCALLTVSTLWSTNRVSSQQRKVAALQQQLTAQALDPAQTTRVIHIVPSRTAPSRSSLAVIGASGTELADLYIDMSWSHYVAFTVTIDRIDQGRVAVLHNVQRDSNGALHLALNSSALGPGDYELSIDGLTWRGQPVAQAWATISIAHPVASDP
jgi:hypothetical protein